MRISLIGPGDINFHFYQLLKINKDRLDLEINEISKVLAKLNIDLEILPDNGISLEISKKYKENNGGKLIGTYPKDDKTFGVKHLDKIINEKINNKHLFDDFINTKNWYKHDLIKGILGNAILYLGSSPGTNGELNYAIYLYKIITKQKENLKISSVKIHKEIKADKNFTIFVYTPFLSEKKLNFETEEYIKKFNIKLVYINSTEELEKELIKFKKLYN